MARHFRVDAAKKIQASPVDFSAFDSFKGSDPEEIRKILEDNSENLETLLITIGDSTLESINSDLRTILNDYIGREGLDDFLSILYKVGVAEDRPIKSQVLEHIYFDTIADDAYIILELNPGLPDSEPAYTSFSLFFDDALDAIWINLHVAASEPTEFIDELITTMTSKEFVNQVTPENVVEICEQLIYEFCKFADSKFSTILEKATIEYMKNR